MSQTETKPAPATAADKTPVEKSRPIPKLSTNGLKTAEFSHTNYDVTPGPGVAPEMLLQPSYWGHVAAKLRPRDEITAIPVDGAWYARYLVLHADKVSARLILLEQKPLEQVKPEDTEIETHRVEWGSPAVKWRVIRKADKAVVKDGFDSKDLATAWMHTNLSAKAA